MVWVVLLLAGPDRRGVVAGNWDRRIWRGTRSAVGLCVAVAVLSFRGRGVLVLRRLGVRYVVLFLPLCSPVLKPNFDLQR